MHASNDDHGKPVLDLDKAPFGHAEAPALAADLSPADAAPVMSLADEQIKSNAEALHSFADEDAPLFPPLNVGMANADEPRALPIPKTEEDSEGPPQRGAQSFSSFVKAQPLASVLAAAVFGALLVGALRLRGNARG